MKDFKNLGPLDYLKIVLQRRWYALAVFLLVAAATIAYAWRMPNVYRSESRVMVGTAIIPQEYVRPSDRSSAQQQIAAIRAAVQSRSFLERMIREFQLFGYGTSEDFSMEGTVRALRGNIEIANTSQDTFTIAFSSTDPQRAQAFTKRMVETLIQSNTSSRKTKAIETDQFLDEQLRQTEQKLAEYEEKIKQFKMAHMGELPEQSEANMNALNRLDVQLASTENAIQQLHEKQKLLEIMAEDQKRMILLTQDIVVPQQNLIDMESESPESNPLLSRKEAELEALKLKYTSQHPDVVRLEREVRQLRQQLAMETEERDSGDADESMPLAREEMTSQFETPGSLADVVPSPVNVEMETIKNDIQRREKEREDILSQMKQLQGKLNLAPALEQELMIIAREHANLQKQYENLQNKKFQAQMTANLETNKNQDTYKVIDEANLPEKPSFPDRLQIVLMGLGAGFGLGIVAAFGREFLDTTLSDEEEVAAVLKLPVLATIAEVPAKEPRKFLKMRKSA